MIPAVELRDVNLSLGRGPARVHILRDLTLTIEAGEALGLVGRSGSGKTTLLMVLAGLERPDSGSVLIAGERIDQWDEDRLARFRRDRIGIIFQSFHLLPAMTALENVAVPLELAGWANAYETARSELRAVGLSDRGTHYPSQLSGGEQQRVAIARALACRPSLLIADEPTGNLDEATSLQILDLIFELQRARGATLVVVTHDRALAQRCGRTAHIRAGRIVEAEDRNAMISAHE